MEKNKLKAALQAYHSENEGTPLHCLDCDKVISPLTVQDYKAAGGVGDPDFCDGCTPDADRVPARDPRIDKDLAVIAVAQALDSARQHSDGNVRGLIRALRFLGVDPADVVAQLYTSGARPQVRAQVQWIVQQFDADQKVVR